MWFGHHVQEAAHIQNFRSKTKPDGKRQDTSYIRHRHRWEDTIKMNLKESELTWHSMLTGGGRLANTVMSLRVTRHEECD
jgi:hypothetical protein